MLRDFTAPIRSAAVALIALVVLGIAPLSACGVKGPLKLPTTPATGARPADSPAKPGPETYIDPAPQPPSTAP